MKALIPLALLGILLAAPAAPAAPASLLGAAAPVAVPALVGPVSVATPSFDRNAIFEILCGGRSVLEPALRAHLWQVAGSLADRGWTPPQVTVRVVVRTPGR